MLTLLHLCEISCIWWEGSTCPESLTTLVLREDFVWTQKHFLLWEEISLGRVYPSCKASSCLFLEALGVKEGIPGGIRQQQAPSDSIGEVACCCQGLLLSCTFTQASLSGEPVATVTDLLFFIKLATIFTHSTFYPWGHCYFPSLTWGV